MAEDLRSDETKFWHGQIAKAVAAERERCAQIADLHAAASTRGSPVSSMAEDTWGEVAAKAIAKAIRDHQ